MTPGAGYRVRATTRIRLMAGFGLVLTACAPQEPEIRFDADAIVVGAGLSGLSAAVDMGRAGVDVLVVDMNSMAGGHAIMAVLGGFFLGVAHYPNLIIGGTVSVATLGFALFIMLFETLVALIQAYIFTVLSAIFVSLAVAEEH